MKHKTITFLPNRTFGTIVVNAETVASLMARVEKLVLSSICCDAIRGNYLKYLINAINKQLV